MKLGSSSSRGAGGVALLLIVVAVFWIEGWKQPPQVDDAYISYRYARNLVEGHGLVYNVGERVEGFSNLLWTLLVAAGLAFGLQAASVAHALALASGTVALVATFAYASTGVDRARWWIAAIAPVLVLSWIGFPVWTFSGLETPLFAATVAVALAAEARGRIAIAALASMVATMTRPEGPLLAAVILGANALRGAPLHRRRSVAWAAVYLVGLALLTGLRLWYYGSLVPNTYHAKVGFNLWAHGLGDFGRFLWGSVLPLLIPAVWVLWRDRVGRVGAVWALAMATYIVSVGGDAFPHHRFWVPVFIVIAVLAARALIASREATGSRVGALPMWTFAIAAMLWSVVSAKAAIVLLLCMAVAALAGLWGARARRAVALGGFALAALALVVARAPWMDDARFSQWIEAGARLLNSRVPAPAPRVKQVALLVLRSRGVSSRNAKLHETREGIRDLQERADDASATVLERVARGEQIDLVAAVAIGKFGYDIRLPVLDMLGLVDPHIARSPRYEPSKPVLWLAGHMRTDADYVFSRQPDYIFVPRPWSSPVRLPVHDDVWSHPRLERDYEWDGEMRAFRRR